MRLALIPPIRHVDLELVGRSGRDVVHSAMVRGAVVLVCFSATFVLLIRPHTLGSVLSVSAVSGAVSLWSARASIAELSRDAERKRADIDLAVAVILDLINIQTAGGAGIETALMTAVSVGDNWAFDGIRECLSAAHAGRRSYWEALLDLGSRWGSRSLIEVAHAGRLTGAHGARVRQSLISKASSLRARNLARVEHQAQERTEQMGVPMVLLFVSFICFVGYPALAQTMGSL